MATDQEPTVEKAAAGEGDAGEDGSASGAVAENTET